MPRPRDGSGAASSQLGEARRGDRACPTAPGLPDLVFTANAAVVLDRTVLLARFPIRNANAKEPFRGRLPRLASARHDRCGAAAAEGLVLEGAGDCVLDRARNLFWMDMARAPTPLPGRCRRTVRLETVALELADGRFYHMDTALSALPGGEVMFYRAPSPRPAAPRFMTGGTSRAHRDQHRRRLPACANAVCLGNSLVMSGASERLRAKLAERGYQVVTNAAALVPRSGDRPSVLTLRLDLRSTSAGATTQQTAVA